MSADTRPHSRACGFRCQGHGPACSTNCPSCGGRPVLAARIAMDQVLTEVKGERLRQIVKWGDDSAKDHPDGTRLPLDTQREAIAKLATDHHADQGTVTWRHILTEEVAEAYAAESDADLRAELIQVAAVAVKWVEAIDRRTP